MIQRSEQYADKIKSDIENLSNKVVQIQENIARVSLDINSNIDSKMECVKQLELLDSQIRTVDIERSRLINNQNTLEWLTKKTNNLN